VKGLTGQVSGITANGLKNLCVFAPLRESCFFWPKRAAMGASLLERH
jgi:hypothetical protein